MRPIFRAVLIAVALITTAPSSAASGAHSATPFVRVDQVGYVGSAGKRAFLLSRHSATGEMFTVANTAGMVVATGRIGPSVGAWSARYPFVHRLDFNAVTAGGTYRVLVNGAVHARSPPFRIGTAASLYAPLIVNARRFFTAQRDGPDVDPTVLGRRPSHLNDVTARVYAPPTYSAAGLLTHDLTPVGGSVDASGGWFDAGDDLKFVETHSYALDVLLLGLRDHPEQMGAAAPVGADFTAEAKFGLRWLLRMWNDRTGTLAYQVGLGDGNGCGTICGDHDIWRLPEADDAGPAGARYRYIRNRPALRAGLPGAPISPNLAGRLTAAFALCHDVFASTDPELAATCLHAARHVYALADTNPGALLSTSPHDYYGEDSWQDDMELGAVTLAHAVNRDEASGYLAQAAHWAHAWIVGNQRGDSLNLYDVSALADGELYRAMTEPAVRVAGLSRAALQVSRAALLGDLRHQLDPAVAQAAKDPFGAGFAWNQFDVTSHLFGLVSTADIYDELTASHRYAAFETRQLAAAFGANAWGTSFVVGAGTTYPHCMQHQVANLVGSLDGTDPVMLGATVNGPNAASEFRGSSGTPDGSRACPAGGGDAFARFTGAQGARYQDNVAAWMSVEPAIDFTAAVPLALSLVMAHTPKLLAAAMFAHPFEPAARGRALR